MMTRRALLRTTAIIAPAALALQGCQWLQGIRQNLPQWTQDANTTSAALGVISAALSSIQGIPADVVAKFNAAVSAAQSLAAQLTSAAGAGASSLGSLVSSFGQTVSGAVATIGGITVPSWVSTALSAIATLLPTILSVAGIALAGPPNAPRAVAAARAYLVALAA